MTPQDPREKLARLMAEKAAAEKGLFCDRFDALVTQMPGAPVFEGTTYQELHSQMAAMLRQLDRLQLPEGSLIALGFDDWHHNPKRWPLILALFYTSHTLLLPEFEGMQPAAMFCRFSDLGARLIIGPDADQVCSSDITSYLSWSAFNALQPGDLAKRPVAELPALMLTYQEHQVLCNHGMLAARLGSLQALLPLPRKSRVALPEGPDSASLLYGLIWPLLHGAVFLAGDEADLTYRFLSQTSKPSQLARLELSLDPTCTEMSHFILAPPMTSAILGHRPKGTASPGHKTTLLPNQQPMIIDAALARQPVGQDGCLAITAVVGPGFWRDPVATACHFVPDPHADEPGARMLLLPIRARQLGQKLAVDIKPSTSLPSLCYPYSEIRDIALRTVAISATEAHHQVYYVVAGSAEDVASLPNSLQDDPSCHLVMLDALPLDRCGILDRDALESLPILHRSVVQQEADLAHALKKPVHLTYGALS